MKKWLFGLLIQKSYVIKLLMSLRKHGDSWV